MQGIALSLFGVSTVITCFDNGTKCESNLSYSLSLNTPITSITFLSPKYWRIDDSSAVAAPSLCAPSMITVGSFASSVNRPTHLAALNPSYIASSGIRTPLSLNASTASRASEALLIGAFPQAIWSRPPRSRN